MGKILQITVGLMLMSFIAFSQEKIKDGSVAGNNLSNKDAILELESISKGLLFTRVSLKATTDASPLSAHVAGMMVYNIATAGDVTPGIYYNDGLRWVSAKGLKGDAGNILIESQPGKTGQPGIPGQPGGPGAGTNIVINDSGTWIYNPATQTWTNMSGTPGPKGDKGDAGLTGAQGPIGLTGATGAQGPIGLTGPAGAQGPKGDKGDAGLTGAQGPIGLTGAAGAQGPIGLTGPAGVQGPKGDKGDTGPAGSKGDKGEDGNSGPPGTPGIGGITQAGIGININGSGTAADPYIINNTVVNTDNQTISSFNFDNVTGELTLVLERGNTKTVNIGAVKAKASNGLGVDAATGEVQLGGTLLKPTTIALGANPLAITGLPATGTTADQILVANGAGGELRTMAASNFVQDLRLVDVNNHLTQDAGVGSNGTSVGSGSDIVAIGKDAISKNTSGAFNVAIGSNALRDNTVGQYNIGIGRNALGLNTTGLHNTAVGWNSLVTLNGGNNNVGVGTQTLATNLNGNNNTAIGRQAGGNLQGSGNVVLGYQAGYNQTGDNRLMIDNSNTNNPLIDGDFAGRKLTINSTLKIADLATGAVVTAGNRPVVADANGQLMIGATPATITADNGLTQSANNIQLGGTLTGATTITTDANKTLAVAGLQAGASTDKVVTADANGVLRQLDQTALTIEPLQVQGTTNKATANNMPAYLNSNLALGDFTNTTSAKKLEVKGDLRTLAQATDGTYHKLETNASMNGNLVSTLSVGDNADATQATVKGELNIDKTQVNLTAKTPTYTNRLTLDGAGLNTYSTNGPNISNLTVFSQDISLNNAGATKSASLNLGAVYGLNFLYKDVTTNTQEANYVFPRNNGTANQVLTTDGAGSEAQLSWKDASALAPEPLQVQGTTNKATANNVPAYLNSNLALGDFTNTTSAKKLEVKGDFKTSVQAADGYYYNMETNNTLVGGGANFISVANDPNFATAPEVGVLGISAGGNSLLSRTPNGTSALVQNGNVGLLATSTDQNNSAALSLTASFGVNTINLTNQQSTTMNVASAKGVNFIYQKPFGGVEGNYIFPRDNGTANQVLTTDGAGSEAQLSWKDASVLAPEPWRIENTTNPATTNIQNIYQDGNVGLGDFMASKPIARLDVRGAVRGGTPHAQEIDGTSAVGVNSAAFGLGNRVLGQAAFAAGINNRVAGIGNVALGRENDVAGPNFGIAVGYLNKITSDAAAIGYNNTIDANYSIGIGSENNIANTGAYSAAIGQGNTVSGQYAIGIGQSNTSSGQYSATLGVANVASGPLSLAIGGSNMASGQTSVALGTNLKATSNVEFVLGRFNAITTGDANNWVATDALFQIGNGADAANPANALTVLKNGNTGIQTAVPNSALTVNGSANNLSSYDAANSTTIDFSRSNLAYSTANRANTFDLTNLKDGGTYTLALKGNDAGTAAFTATGYTIHLPTDHGPSVANKHSVYTLIVMGTDVYMSWIAGY
ncbi:beta strand repeat-containing protein [Pedobacter sp. ASV12]|uniref:beta strand repeat-containing protein n=1 Tax=Pedobacter sp. ASV12 TaxID=2795120 RepID=UPI001E5229C5|nr:hypothetical protein [Pedobacter sp. ASV12]